MHSVAETARHWQGPFRGCAQKWQVAVQKVVSLSWAGLGKIGKPTFMKNSPSSESIFTDEDASVCDILRSVMQESRPSRRGENRRALLNPRAYLDGGTGRARRWP